MRTLVAGIGNIFFGDDAFGSEVARRLLEDPGGMPEGVKVGDFGIRGIHLAYELLDGYDTAILVDATAQGGEPGTVYVMEPDLDAIESESGLAEAGIADAHGMDPSSVLALLRSLGGSVGHLLVVGCEPADTDEHMGLSGPVAAAVDEAARVVRDLVHDELNQRKEPAQQAQRLGQGPQAHSDEPQGEEPSERSHPYDPTPVHQRGAVGGRGRRGPVAAGRRPIPQNSRHVADADLPDRSRPLPRVDRGSFQPAPDPRGG